jgi:hypothetical protein
VLRDAGDACWRVVGEADRRPGLRADEARRQAVKEVTGGSSAPGTVYAVVLRGEWRVAASV